MYVCLGKKHSLYKVWYSAVPGMQQFWKMSSTDKEDYYVVQTICSRCKLYHVALLSSILFLALFPYLPTLL
jgi:hypothetical protein